MISNVVITHGPGYLDIAWSDDETPLFYEVSTDGGRTWAATGTPITRHRAEREPGQYEVVIRSVTATGIGDTAPIAPYTLPPSAITVTTALLIGQWREAARLKAVIEIGIDAFRQRIEVQHQRLRAMARIADAEGVWLDRLGRRYGVHRPYVTSTVLSGVDDRFGFDEAGVGFDQAPFRGAPENDAYFPLPDPLYRRFIQARAVLDTGDGTIATFAAGARKIDPSAGIRDNHDMTVTVATDPANRWKYELADRIGAIPRSAGVRMIIQDRGRFGFDEAGTGFNQGPFAP